jgi:hypothetical protein
MASGLLLSIPFRRGRDMCSILIWMDSVEAKLFYVEAESIRVEKVKFHGHVHPTETLGKNHPQDQTDQQVFFKQLIKKLEGESFKRLFLMGPSLGATHFYSYLGKGHLDIFTKVIGLEKVGKMPDSEILSVGQKYLQKYYLRNVV